MRHQRQCSRTATSAFCRLLCSAHTHTNNFLLLRSIWPTRIFSCTTLEGFCSSYLALWETFSLLSQRKSLNVFKHPATCLWSGKCTVNFFYNSVITNPVVCACIVIEMGSHHQKWFLFHHTTLFSTKGLEKVTVLFHRNHFCSMGEPCLRRK